MDDSSAAKLLRPPPQQAADPPAPPPVDSGRRITMSGQHLRSLAFVVLLSDYFKIVSKNFAEGAHADAPGDPLRWRLPLLVALAYAAAAVLIWFLGRLERRRRQPDGRDARWEKRVKIAAQILAYLIIVVLAFYSASATPCALFVFKLVGSGDHFYIERKAGKEQSEDK